MKKQKTHKSDFSDERVETKSSQPPVTSVSDALKDLGSTTAKTMWEELFAASAKQIPEQILSQDAKSHGKGNSGELKKNEEVSLKAKEKALAADFHREYFREIQYTETRKIRNEQQFLEQRIQEILVELKRLTKSSSEMKILFKEVSNEDMPTEAGTYHIHFFEWVLSLIRNARVKMDEGNNWLAMFASKKKQKGYWNMSKKHGTTFSLSQERSMATQTG